jgi:hypothetical protein
MASPSDLVDNLNTVSLDAVGNKRGLLSPYRNSLVPAHSPHGIFGEFPGMTPKYARNNSDHRGDNYRETMARLYLRLSSPEALRAYLSNIRANSPKSYPLAEMLAGTGTAGGSGYIDFILTSAQHAFGEKREAVEFLNDDFVIYYYGQSPPVFNYSGMLMNTLQDDQASNMFRMYEDMLRGTALARDKQAVSLRYSGWIVTGYFDSFSFGLSGDNENVCPFNFQMTIKEMRLAPNLSYGLAPLSDAFDGAALVTAAQVSGTSVNVRSLLPAAGSAAATPLPSDPGVTVAPFTNTQGSVNAVLQRINQNSVAP